MTALFARALYTSRVAVFQRLLPAVRIRLVSLASRVTADLADHAVAAWRVIHGFFASLSQVSILLRGTIAVYIFPHFSQTFVKV